MLLKTIHKMLLKLPPETAHRVAAWGLGHFKGTVPRQALPKGPGLILGKGRSSFKLSHRVGLAAGFDKNAEMFGGLSRFGFGFIEVGTVTPLPQPGNPKPRLFRVKPQSLINHMGFNNCGLAVFRQNIRRQKSRVQLPLLANIGKGRHTPENEALEDYRKGFQFLEKDVDGFVVNLSSPNTPGLVKLQSVAFLEGIEENAPKDLPLFVKFSPDLDDSVLTELCAWLKESKVFTGVVLTNTSRTLAESHYQAPVGGLSGPPIHERSIRCVELARQSIGGEKVVIGVGGIQSLKDAQDFRRAGADAVEIYTGFVYRGAELMSELSRLD